MYNKNIEIYLVHLAYQNNIRVNKNKKKTHGNVFMTAADHRYNIYVNIPLDIIVESKKSTCEITIYCCLC